MHTCCTCGRILGSENLELEEDKLGRGYIVVVSGAQLCVVVLGIGLVEECAIHMWCFQSWLFVQQQVSGLCHINTRKYRFRRP